MWIYEKKLEYPVRVSKKDVKMAKYLITQYGGPDLRFYSQNPTRRVFEIGYIHYLELMCRKKIFQVW